MESYTVIIRKKIVQERREGEYHCKSTELEIETKLPFVPMIGMRLMDLEKGIDIDINNVTWSGDDNAFWLQQRVSELNEKEANDCINLALSKGWKIIESLT